MNPWLRKHWLGFYFIVFMYLYGLYKQNHSKCIGLVRLDLLGRLHASNSRIIYVSMGFGGGVVQRSVQIYRPSIVVDVQCVFLRFV